MLSSQCRFAPHEPRARRIVSIALIALGLSGAPDALEAQEIRGAVSDHETYALLPGAAIWLLDDLGGPLGAGVSSNDSGQFAVRLPRPGRYRLRIARIGYAAVTTEVFDLARGQVVTLQIWMERRAPILSTVTVTERSNLPASGGFSGFDLRRSRGMGKFITRADIEQLAPVVFLDIIGGVPGVRIIHVSSGRQVVRMNRASPMMRRAGRVDEASGVLETEGVVAENNCPVIFYLDGMRLNHTGDASLDRVEVIYRLPVDQIQAVEIYRGASELPAEFGGADARCGVVVVWTRRGR